VSELESHLRVEYGVLATVSTQGVFAQFAGPVQNVGSHGDASLSVKNSMYPSKDRVPIRNISSEDDKNKMEKREKVRITSEQVA